MLNTPSNQSVNLSFMTSIYYVIAYCSTIDPIIDIKMTSQVGHFTSDTSATDLMCDCDDVTNQFRLVQRPVVDDLDVDDVVDDAGEGGGGEDVRQGRL